MEVQGLIPWKANLPSRGPLNNILYDSNKSTLSVWPSLEGNLHCWRILGGLWLQCIMVLSQFIQLWDWLQNHDRIMANTNISTLKYKCLVKSKCLHWHCSLDDCVEYINCICRLYARCSAGYMQKMVSVCWSGG